MLRAITSREELLALVRRRKPAVVSFDLFDTLVHRTVVKPKDVFLIQGRRLSRSGLIHFPAAEWLARRVQAEQRLMKALAPGEVRLEQIYDALLAAGDLPSPEARDAALALELAIEREVMRLFAFVPELLAAVKRTGARVVVLSDTYLPLSFIREVLAPVAPLIDEILCSCEVQKTKRYGHAFALLRNRGKVLHFGDHPRSDRLRAWRNGIDGRLIRWERQRWLRRNRAELALLRLRGSEVPPLPDPGLPPLADSLEDVAVRWSIVLFDFLLDLRARARTLGASDVWLASRDCESIWAVLRDCPQFFGPIAVRYIRVSRKATHTIMARADPDRHRRWQGQWPSPVDPEAGLVAQRYYLGLLRPETRRILVADMISRGRMEESLRVALPRSLVLSGYYFSLQPVHEASAEARQYLPWGNDQMHASAVEMLSGYSEGTCLGFRDAGNGVIEPVLECDPVDAAPKAFVDTLRDALRRLVEADLDGSDLHADAGALLAARRAVVRPLTMFPGRKLAESMRGWHFASPHDHPAHDVFNSRAPLVPKLLSIASRDNRWPSVALYSAVPAWLVPALQWLAIGRLKIKNRLQGEALLQAQATPLVGQHDRG